MYILSVLLFLWQIYGIIGMNLNVDSTSTIQRVAFGSCYNPNRGGDIWKLIKSFEPNELLLLGDQFYADMTSEFQYRKTSLDTIREQYSTFAADPNWKDLIGTVNGWMATFDDHDYGINNGDKRFRFRNQSQDLFWQFTNSSPLNEHGSRKSGVFSSKTVRVAFNDHKFVYKIILLDTRSNKDKRGTPRGDFLGDEQWEWLARELMDPEPQLFLVGSGIQILPDDKIVEETWDEFPQSRARLLKLLTLAARKSDVLLLSGDIHSAEISQAKCSLSSASSLFNQYEGVNEIHPPSSVHFYEFTSSGLGHTFTRSSVLRDNNVQSTEHNVDNENGHNNSSVQHPEVLVASRGQLKEMFFSLYQAFYPAQYREQKFKHFYGGLHFGLLDIVVSNSHSHHDLATEEEATGDKGECGGGGGGHGNTSSTSSQQQFHVVFRIIDHKGHSVMSKSLLLRDRSGGSGTSRGTFGITTRRDAAVHNVNGPDVLTLEGLQDGHGGDIKQFLVSLDKELVLSCAAYWGNLPRYKHLLFKLMLAIAALLCVIAPLMSILWILLAGMYRLTRGHDDAEEERSQARVKEVKRILAAQGAKKAV